MTHTTEHRVEVKFGESSVVYFEADRADAKGRYEYWSRRWNSEADITSVTWHDAEGDMQAGTLYRRYC